MSATGMSVPMALNHYSKEAFWAELDRIKQDGGRQEEVARLTSAAKAVRCFYCLDLGVCYKDRQGLFANLDGCGDYDIVTCPSCASGGAQDGFVECSRDPEAAHAGILKRGDRERMFWERSPTEGTSVVAALGRKIAAAGGGPALGGRAPPAGSAGPAPTAAPGTPAETASASNGAAAAAAPRGAPDRPPAAKPRRASSQPVAERPPVEGLDGAPLQTVFAPMVPNFVAARIEGAGGELEDVKMESFFSALGVYREAAPHLGKTVLWVFADFDSNFTVCKKHFDEDPASRRTLRGFLQADLDAGLHRPRQQAKPFLKDPSGACQLQWLLRAMEFFIASLHFIFVENDNKGFSAAYAQTLSNYHSGMTAWGAKALLVAMPGKEGICAMESICPEAPDATSRTDCICDDMSRMTAAVLPVVRKMIAIMKDMDLWEDGRV